MIPVALVAWNLAEQHRWWTVRGGRELRVLLIEQWAPSGSAESLRRCTSTTRTPPVSSTGCMSAPARERSRTTCHGRRTAWAYLDRQPICETSPS